MLRTTPRGGRRPAAALGLTLALAMTAACGNVTLKPKADGSGDKTGSTSSPSAQAQPEVDTSAAAGDWLVAIGTAAGADAETVVTTYLTYDPSTGRATAHKLPGYRAPSADSADAALLVSADRRWAVPDTGLTPQETDSGKLRVYSLVDGSTKDLDIRALTRTPDLKALGWAFDPSQPEVLRVVDSASRVWTVDLTAGTATKSGTLAKGPWVFTNGFNRNTGEPYVESIDSDLTRPPGNGDRDTSAVQREDGEVVASDSEAAMKLPKSPCRLGGAFVDRNGTTWEICADSASLTTYYLPKGSQDWVSFGKQSTPVAPEAASLRLVLPPKS